MSRTRLPVGVGVFIHPLDGLDITAVVKKAQANNVNYLMPKFADGREPRQHEAITKFIPACHAAGIEVWGWPYIYGNAPAGEAETTAKWYSVLGFDGLVIDAEQEYKNHTSNAKQFTQRLRLLLPDDPIGLSSYGIPSLHTEFPWAEFMAGMDFIMPQVYYSSFGMTPKEALARSLDDCRKFKKQVIVTGGDTDDNNFDTEGMEEFIKWAETWHTNGVNWWHWDSISGPEWKVIKQSGKKTTPIKVVDHATGKLVETLQMVPGGWHPEQNKLYVKRISA